MKRFLKASGFLSKRVYSLLSSLPAEVCTKVCEIRLRSGKPLCLVTFDGCLYITSTGRTTGILNSQLFTVSKGDIKESFTRICDYSVYSYAKDISSGFITVSGGHRAGIYGTAVYNGNEITSVRDIGGINLRIAREYSGCASQLIKQVSQDGFGGFLICGAPSTGKTTLLRDTARIISDTFFKKVCIVDERGEIAAVSHGEAQNDVGINTDVLDGYIKAGGISQGVRTLSPDVIICDELGSREDIEAVINGVNSGVMFISSVHATSVEDIKKKQGLTALIETDAFEKIVFLKSGVPCEISSIITAKEITG